MKELDDMDSFRIGGTVVNNLRYADDTVIISNFSLNHFACIGHIIFDYIFENHIIYEPFNPFNHSVVLMYIAIDDFNHITPVNSKQAPKL